MTDKKKTVSTKDIVDEKNVTPELTPSTPEKKAVKPSDKAANQTKPTIKNKAQPSGKKTPIIIAIIALILTLVSWGVIAYIYSIFEAQKNTFKNDIQQTIIAQTREQLTSQKALTAKLLAEQSISYEERLHHFNSEVTEQSQKTIDKLQRTVDQLSATKPSDWLIHEAQYLIRVAVRTLWLEKDTSAAISLLTDADSRLKELNDPSFLSVRQVLREDITRLQLLPQLNIDEILLKLMALTSQVSQLSLATEDILAEQETEEAYALTDDVNDWKANLAQTWQQFVSDFITIRRHDENIEPLLSVEHKQNLLTNIRLKLQQAQWAATHGKETVYRQTLTDIQVIVSDYFSKEAIVNQSFDELIEALKEETVAIDYPEELVSFNAINQAIEKKSVSHIDTTLEIEKADTETVDIEKVNVENIILPAVSESQVSTSAEVVSSPTNEADKANEVEETQVIGAEQSIPDSANEVTEEIVLPEVKDAI